MSNRLLPAMTVLMCLAAASAGLTAAAAGSKRTVCQLYLEGYGSNTPGFKSARLSCSGGVIKVMADSKLQKVLQKGSKGVVWSEDVKDSNCRQLQKDYWCWLSICGGSVATFVQPVVRNTWEPEDKSGVSSVVCVGGASQVAFEGGIFSGVSNTRAVVASDVGTLIDVKGCTFDKISIKGKGGAALLVSEAKALVQSSRFTHNMGDTGAAIRGDTGAAVYILPGEQTSPNGCPGCNRDMQ